MREIIQAAATMLATFALLIAIAILLYVVALPSSVG